MEPARAALVREFKATGYQGSAFGVHALTFSVEAPAGWQRNAATGGWVADIRQIEGIWAAERMRDPALSVPVPLEVAGLLGVPERVAVGNKAVSAGLEVFGGEFIFSSHPNGLKGPLPGCREISAGDYLRMRTEAQEAIARMAQEREVAVEPERVTVRPRM